jgi:hypothetical protein
MREVLSAAVGVGVVEHKYAEVADAGQASVRIWNAGLCRQKSARKKTLSMSIRVNVESVKVIQGGGPFAGPSTPM